MEGFVYSPFGTYQSFRGGPPPGRSRDPAVKQPSWKQSKSGGISPVLGGPLSPLPSDYLDSYRRAQLQALLSQVNPGLAPRRRRPVTREVGVQVTLRADAAVQCSLGPRTLPFLEQKYGYFHCKDCKTRWESAYVWCISGSNKVYFKQLCRKCQKGFNPYRVEAIQCQTCSKTRCSCPQKKRHIDLKRPHRQELCGRCKGKRLSCDNTYSFKYIV
ncbi:PREDICTED: ZAR1-like protein [Charadrius vociferus]|uniref:ZAR1-like protein n=1 Tax=Charadrius vociferus TaxID=50402 RepID=UPI00052199CB|nr:PREDICTED: ZAR1-like protein [Charadrius vociferus]